MKKLAIIAALATLAGCAQTSLTTETEGEKREYVVNESLEDAYYRLTNPTDSESACARTSVLRSDLYPQRQEFAIAWGNSANFQDYTQAFVRGYKLSDTKTKLVYSTKAPTSIVRESFATCIRASK